jgi:hypothetical protein
MFHSSQVSRRVALDSSVASLDLHQATFQLEGQGDMDIVLVITTAAFEEDNVDS